MNNLIWKLSQQLKLTKIKLFGSDFEKLMVEVIDEYFYQTSEGKSHQEAIEIIITRQFDDSPQMQKDTILYVFSEIKNVDKFYNLKYGSKGMILSHLHKLTQKIYIAEQDEQPQNGLEGLVEMTEEIIKKRISDISLVKFDKYHGRLD